ncbi:MAG: DUF6441 family protein [bacterium]
MSGELEVQISYIDVKKALEQNIKRRLDKAALDSMKEVKELGLKYGRSAIGRGGGKFSSKPTFKKGLRANLYENEGDNPAVFFYHKIPYANIFEEGGSIQGNPFLWLPLRSIAGKAKSPKQFKKKFPNAKLRLAKKKRGSNRAPLLVANILTGAGFKRGVPVFIGIPRVTIPKKFNVRGAIKRAFDRFPEIYKRQLRKFG